MDRKLVDGLPLLLETVPFSWETWADGWLALGSESADFAWNLFLWETQFPFPNNLWENGENFKVAARVEEVLGNGKFLNFVGRCWGGEVEK